MTTASPGPTPASAPRATPFRLQPVLDYRTTLVDRLRLELAALRRRQQAEAERLAALQAAERQALAALRAQQAPTAVPDSTASVRSESSNGEESSMLDLPQLMQLTEHLHLLEARIAAQQEVVARLATEEAELQQRIVAQSKDVKALEKLRDRQQEEHARAEARLERRETSELAIRQYQRLRAAL